MHLPGRPIEARVQPTEGLVRRPRIEQKTPKSRTDWLCAKAGTAGVCLCGASRRCCRVVGRCSPKESRARPRHGRRRNHRCRRRRRRPAGNGCPRSAESERTLPRPGTTQRARGSQSGAGSAHVGRVCASDCWAPLSDPPPGRTCRGESVGEGANPSGIDGARPYRSGRGCAGAVVLVEHRRPARRKGQNLAVGTP